ncbi:DegV family protein [Nocardioides sp. GY 10127]|uniref:DegV family protein n=1 Tax=Nocardioides sp. GY 10127 TaxID=2569762 RepID=UPI0010A8A363|nr:DegV family protein [Nocardioides sp. GY 10127]TIC84000.1 DegV family EDD domain-containing protein [Nocardioides sp. GY 10127]
MGVAVVTDSTASLPAGLAVEHGLTVVGLDVVLGDERLEEGPDGATPARLVAALEARRQVSTSRPSPERLVALWEGLAAAGADAVVAVHLSGEVSGTVESARLAARRLDLPVEVVDSRQVGPATGLAALAAADAAAGGAGLQDCAEAARRCAARATTLCYVDTLEHLRRGGRIGPAAALLGGALAVKPLLTVTDGRVAPLERVRTASRALARLEELAVEAALGARDTDGSGERVRVVVGHLATPERAVALRDRLDERLSAALGDAWGGAWESEVTAALGAHTGPGMLAVGVAPA